MPKYPRECPAFKIVAPAMIWRGMVVEGVGWENWDCEAHIKFYNPEIDDIDGYCHVSLQPLTPAAKAMLAAAKKHVADEMKTVLR